MHAARPHARLLCALVATLSACDPGAHPEADFRDGNGTPLAPAFSLVQEALFSSSGAQTNAWADYDGDGDLDLFVGFRGAPNRLYRNDLGSFVDVATEAGLAEVLETRAAAWGDYDGDGDLDLYVGFATGETENRLYRNDGSRFVDVADVLGVSQGGTTRQPAFIDYDGDGDLDLFVAFRDRANTLFRNDGASFTDVTQASRIGDERRTVGVAWFDMDGDGDLDAFVANQNGDEDGFFRNNGDGTFDDIARDLRMNQPGRADDLGSVGTAVADYDNDGDLDLFVASYGPDVLWQNQGNGTFIDVAPGTPLAGDHHSVAADWGDVDNDGWLDLYVDTFLASEAEARDYLFRGGPNGFEEVLPTSMMMRGASHGVRFADYDGDGDLDLALANNHADGAHPLYRNDLTSDRSSRSLQVAVLDADGRWVRAGATVTLHRESDDFRSTRIVDSGGGYASQNAGPVHFGLPPGSGDVSVTVSWFGAGERRTTAVTGIQPGEFQSRWLIVSGDVRQDSLAGRDPA